MLLNVFDRVRWLLLIYDLLSIQNMCLQEMWLRRRRSLLLLRLLLLLLLHDASWLLCH